MDTLQEILDGQRRIENKLDMLLQALADEDEDDVPAMTLDGDLSGAVRAEHIPL